MGIHVWTGIRPIRVQTESGEWTLAYPFEPISISEKTLQRQPALVHRLVKPTQYLEAVKQAPQPILNAWQKWTRDGHPAKTAVDLRAVFSDILGSVDSPMDWPESKREPSLYDGQRLRDLREICKSRGLPTYGNKTDVIRRLEAADNGCN